MSLEARLQSLTLAGGATFKRERQSKTTRSVAVAARRRRSRSGRNATGLDVLGWGSGSGGNGSRRATPTRFGSLRRRGCDSARVVARARVGQADSLGGLGSDVAGHAVDVLRHCQGRESLEPQRAIALWHALIAGNWSVVNHTDSDGKRFILARRNASNISDPAALTPNERSVAHLAAFEHSSKLIAYELGVSASVVSERLKVALAKLGLRTRAELVQVIRAGWAASLKR